MYAAEWWKTDIRAVHQAAVLIIQRSNNVSTLKAGGVKDLDMQSFIEIDRVPDAIYESDWWRADTMHLKKAVLFIIQRSQVSKNFSAGGMVELDLQSFTKVK
ncbi:hypothetical protein CBL_09543 [Carabus blaptoides fortunei]